MCSASCSVGSGAHLTIKSDSADEAASKSDWLSVGVAAKAAATPPTPPDTLRLCWMSESTCTCTCTCTCTYMQCACSAHAVRMQCTRAVHMQCSMGARARESARLLRGPRRASRAVAPGARRHFPLRRGPRASRPARVSHRHFNFEKGTQLHERAPAPSTCTRPRRRCRAAGPGCATPRPGSARPAGSPRSARAARRR